MSATFDTITATENAHTSGAYPKRPLALVRGEGVYVWDTDGNRYLDATSGQGVALLGHCHPSVVAAVQQQSQTLITCPEIFYNDRRAELYETLGEILPPEHDRFFLCNSGAEAIEGALKVARLVTGRSGIVAAKRAFHGRTLGALSLTWNKKYREPFAAWQPDVTHITYDDADGVMNAITDDTAAVVVEVVQGEGGVYPASTEFLRQIGYACDATGALMIVDEIQTGLGRTGRWFAFQHHGIMPDVIAMGKGIAGGLPMGAVVWRGDLLGTLDSGAHGSTFGGNPLASAAAAATVRALIDMDAPAHAADLGAWFVDEINRLDLTAVREVRASGLMIGIELRTRVTPALKALQELGVLALPAGLNVLRLLPPLVITQDELAVALDAVSEVLA